MHVLIATGDEDFQMAAFRGAVAARGEIDEHIQPCSADDPVEVFRLARTHAPSVCIVDADFTRQGGVAVAEALATEAFPTVLALAGDVTNEARSEHTAVMEVIERRDGAVQAFLERVELPKGDALGEHRVLFSGPINVETPPVAEVIGDVQPL